MKPRYKKILKIILYIHGVLLIAGILTHCSFKRYASKSFEEAKSEKPFDAIIVPGVPYDTAEENSVMRIRVRWAQWLYEKGYTKHIIFSGSAVYSPYIEAMVMKTMADSLGIPSELTFAETKAEHSTENAYYSWKLARSLGFQKIALATDPYQAGLLRSFIDKYCPGMHSIPIMFEADGYDPKSLPRINPIKALVHPFVSITERKGFWERWQETRGKRVKEEVAQTREHDNSLAPAGP